MYHFTGSIVMKAVKILSIFVGAMVALFIVGLVALYLFLPKQELKQMAQQQISDAVGRQVVVGDVGVSPWPLGVVIQDISIANASGKGFSDTPLLTLPKVVVALDLAKLFTLEIAVAQVALHDMVLYYEVLADGRTGLDGLGGATSATETADSVALTQDTLEAAPMDFSTIELPASVSLRQFAIKNAKVQYYNKQSKQQITLGKINQTVNLSLDRTLENIQTTGLLTVDELSFQDGTSGIKTGSIHLEFAHDIAVNLRAQLVQLKQMQFGFQTVLVSVNGSVQDFLKPQPLVDLQIASNGMQLGDLFKEIPPQVHSEVSKISAGGVVTFNTSIKGAVGMDAKGNALIPAVMGKLLIENLFLGHSDVPAKVQNVNGEIHFTENTLKIAPFGLQLDAHPVAIALDVQGLTKAPMIVNQFKVDATVDFEKVMALASKIVALPEGFVLKGLQHTQITASGEVDPANPAKIAIDGFSDLKNVYVKVNELPEAVTLNGRTEFSNTLITNELAVKIGSSDVTTRVELKDFLTLIAPELSNSAQKMVATVSVNSANLELDKIMPPLSAEEQKEEEEAGAAALPELPSNIEANVSIRLNRTVFRYLTMSGFAMDVQMKDQVVTTDLKANLYEGTIAQKMTANLKDPNNGLVDFFLDINNVEANDLVTNGNDNLQGESALQKQIRSWDNTIYGKMNMRVDVQTKGTPLTFADNMDGKIAIRLHQGKLVGSKLGSSMVGAVTGWEVAGKKPLNGLIKTDMKDLSFSELALSLTAKEGNLIVDAFDMSATPIGMLALGGKVGFGGDLHLTVQNILPKSVSDQLESLLGGAQKAVSGALAQAGGGNAIAQGLSSKVGSTALYPKDDATGNALLLLDLGGSLLDPKPSINTTRMATATKASASSSEGDGVNLKQAATQKLDDAKEKAAAAAKAAKEKAAAELQAKKDAAKAKADAAKEQTKQEVKKTQAKAKQKTKEATSKAKDEGKKSIKNNIKKFGM
jgi:hypothetical protein